MNLSPPQPFPIGSILLKTYRSLFDNFGYAIRISWAWILVVTSARIGADLIRSALLTTETGQSLVSWNLTFVIGWFLFIPLASIAVAWHRLLLTGERDTSIIYLRLDRLVFSYFWLAVVVYVIALAPILVPWALGSTAKFVVAMLGGDTEGKSAMEVLLTPAGSAAIPFLQTAAVIIFLALTSRLAVVLPGKALRIPDLSIRKAWDATSGNTFNLLMGMFGCFLPFLVLISWVRGMGFNYSAADGPMLHIADWLFVETMAALFSLIQIGYLSYCFQYFFPDQGADQTVEAVSA